jgi:hypothetical protein
MKKTVDSSRGSDIIRIENALMRTVVLFWRTERGMAQSVFSALLEVPCGGKVYENHL